MKEFKPALIFLGKFLGLYLAGNIVYGIYVESFDKRPDDATRLVTTQTSWLLDKVGYDTHTEDVAGAPKVALKEGDHVVLNVYEGCNGINVMIVFVAFLFAFGGTPGKLAVFLPFGILIIHFCNLLRVVLLFNLAQTDATRFYYYHKYFFTATLYLVVFALWAVWVCFINERHNLKATA